MNLVYEQVNLGKCFLFDDLCHFTITGHGGRQSVNGPLCGNRGGSVVDGHRPVGKEADWKVIMDHKGTL